MSVDNQQREISRRSIAKGAAWAAPAVALGAAAPSLAASPIPCSPSDEALTVEVRSCTLVGIVATPYFEICNPNTDCSIPVGTQFTLETSGLIGLDIDLLQSNSNFQLLYTVGNTSTFELTQPILPGSCLEVQVYSASFLSGGVSALQEVRLTMEGQTARFNWTRVCVFGLCTFLCESFF